MNKKRLEGKNVLITGGSNGIGKAIVLAYAREGANISFTYLSDKVSAQETVRHAGKLGVKVKAFQCDCNDLNNIDRIYNNSALFLGHIDVLVNNVGVFTRTRFIDITSEQFKRILTTNLEFPFFLTQRITKHMITNKIKGSIINISSLSAQSAVSKMAHYQCSKAGLSMLSKSVAYEMAALGIRVNTISPGLTATKINQDQWADNPNSWENRVQSFVPMKRAGKPDDFCGIAIFLASDESSWVTGSNINIDGGYSTM